MPTARYEDLLLETCPQVIETDIQYEAAMRPLRELVRKGRARSPGETKLMRLLSVLVQDYDRRYEVLAKDSTPAERLRFVLEESG